MALLSPASQASSVCMKGKDDKKTKLIIVQTMRYMTIYVGIFARFKNILHNI
jgi:hypothetical protein